jgi:hypothetical protein
MKTHDKALAEKPSFDFDLARVELCKRGWEYRAEEIAPGADRRHFFKIPGDEIEFEIYGLCYEGEIMEIEGYPFGGRYDDYHSGGFFKTPFELKENELEAALFLDSSMRKALDYV